MQSSQTIEKQFTPWVHAFTQEVLEEDEYNVMIIDLLGPNLSSLFEVRKQHLVSGKMEKMNNVKMCCVLGQKLVRAIE